MSRIGKLPIKLPEKTTVQVGDGQVTVQGPKGKLQMAVPASMKIAIEGSEVVVTRPDETRPVRALHGMTRAILANAIQGVSQGFTRELAITGVGYKAEAKGREIHFALGYSHPIVYPLPEGISAQTPAPTKIILEGIDRQVLGQVAAEVRALRPPEPYKGKGIRYADEHIRRKVGKTGA